jgi:hypothetical protein
MTCEEPTRFGVSNLFEEVRQLDQACARAVQELDATIAHVSRPEELRRSKGFGDALMLGWLELFQKKAKDVAR